MKNGFSVSLTPTITAHLSADELLTGLNTAGGKCVLNQLVSDYNSQLIGYKSYAELVERGAHIKNGKVFEDDGDYHSTWTSPIRTASETDQAIFHLIRMINTPAA